MSCPGQKHELVHSVGILRQRFPYSPTGKSSGFERLCCGERRPVYSCGGPAAVFQTAMPYHELTKTDMCRRLAGEGVLAQHKERRAATKKIGGKRYLEIRFTNLKAVAQMY